MARADYSPHTRSHLFSCANTVIFGQFLYSSSELRTLRQPLSEFAEAVSELHASGTRRLFNRRELDTRAHRSETREALAEPLLLGESAAYEAACCETRSLAHSAFAEQCSRFECGDGEEEDSARSGWDALLAGLAQLPVEQLASEWSALVGGDWSLGAFGAASGAQETGTRLQWWAHWLFERVGPQLVLHPPEDLWRTAEDLITVLQHVHSPMSEDPAIAIASSSASASVPTIGAALRRLALTNDQTF